MQKHIPTLPCSVVSFICYNILQQLSVPCEFPSCRLSHKPHQKLHPTLEILWGGKDTERYKRLSKLFLCVLSSAWFISVTWLLSASLPWDWEQEAEGCSQLQDLHLNCGEE